mmetsp:Transcript_4629/g.13985  ORF Transcript_4629/g.13985 Transcript_4629/m.13985 type:complete len:183 (+) Transcript_4629:82-630(+)
MALIPLSLGLIDGDGNWALVELVLIGVAASDLGDEVPVGWRGTVRRPGGGVPRGQGILRVLGGTEVVALDWLGGSSAGEPPTTRRRGALEGVMGVRTTSNAERWKDAGGAPPVALDAAGVCICPRRTALLEAGDVVQLNTEEAVSSLEVWESASVSSASVNGGGAAGTAQASAVDGEHECTS